MSERTNSRTSRKRAQRQLRMKRVLLTASLMILVAVVSIGGTIAWLQDDTETITNTFAPTGIDITLTETVEAGITDNTFPLIPSKAYTKDPVVAVDGDKTDVDVYLFVKFEEIGNPAKYFDYTSTLNSDNDWRQGDGTTIPSNVWYREVKTTDTTKEWHLLAENGTTGKQIKVKEGLTAENMPEESNQVQLVYTAYAIQTAGFETVGAAWDEVQGDAPSTGNTTTD